jgi:MerR family transcriptional regulator, light-induced transcriptional regulator
MAELDLSHYSTAPLFNTKAVVRETGVSAATLRAWERRYGVPEPDRTDSNYRLYSERDIALIRWLRERVDGGITISQAVELYRRSTEGEDVPTSLPREPRRLARSEPHDLNQAQARLIEAFKAFEEPRAEWLLSELFALYPLEEVITGVILPVMVEIGEQWHRGELSVPVEHFATAFVQRKLMALMNVQPVNPESPLVVAGCAPHEQHELGIMLFSFFLRRNGLRVLYLGQNVPLVDLPSLLQRLRPAMLALSASNPATAANLQPVADMLDALPPPRPLFSYGGAAFQYHPELREHLRGLYFGDDLLAAARDAAQHIRQRS